MGNSTTTSLGFRNRPIHPDYAVATQISKALRNGRSYQRQHISLSDGFVGSAAVPVGGYTDYSYLALQPGDTVVAASVAVVQVTATTTYDIEINGSLLGSALGGPWSVAPNIINIKPYAAPATESPVSSRLIVRLMNTSGATASFGFQLSVVLLK